MFLALCANKEKNSKHWSLILYIFVKGRSGQICSAYGKSSSTVMLIKWMNKYMQSDKPQVSLVQKYDEVLQFYIQFFSFVI